jgi:hypothetical protein
MWFAILGGVAAGVLILMFITMKQERGYRLLFSDTHLAELAKMIASARTGAPQTTFEGVTVTWERLPRHVALTMTTRAAVAPAAARFLLAFAIELAGKVAPTAALQMDKRNFALVWEHATVDGVVIPTLDDAGLAALRTAAADGMRSLALSEASLAAYR